MQVYRRRQKAVVTAVKLDLETDGFSYRKWGATQRCKAGDWLVSNNGDTYTVDAETFEETYRQASPGVYEKNAPVWAEQADHAGSIPTKEGSTAYSAGDYLVYNKPDRKDGYAMSAETFTGLYDLQESGSGS